MPGKGRPFTAETAKSLGRPFTTETAKEANRKRKRRYVHRHSHEQAVRCGKLNRKTIFNSDTAKIAGKKANDSRFRSKENNARRKLVAFVFRHVRRTRLQRIHL